MNLENFAAHPDTGSPGLLCESGQAVDGLHFAAGVRRNQIRAAIDGVAVGINETREKRLALQVQAFGACRDGPGNFRVGSHRYNLIASNSDSLCVRIFWLRCEDLGVKENALVGATLGV